MIATPNTIESNSITSPASRLDGSPDSRTLLPPPSLRPSVAPSLPPLSPRDEELLFSLLESGPSLAFLIRQHKMTLEQALAWWRQPHIKSALAELADLSQARAKAMASNDAMHAVNALQSCLVLCESEFYEQADPKTRLKAFDSARKAAVQVLRLAGMSGSRPRATGSNSRANSRATGGSSASARPRHHEFGNPSDSAPQANGAIARSSERGMPRDTPSSESAHRKATAASAQLSSSQADCSRVCVETR